MTVSSFLGEEIELLIALDVINSIFLDISYLLYSHRSYRLRKKVDSDLGVSVDLLHKNLPKKKLTLIVFGDTIEFQSHRSMLPFINLG